MDNLPTNSPSSQTQPSDEILPIIGLLIGCVVFGMGSLIVAHVKLGAFAMAFWRLIVSVLIFIVLAAITRQKFPTQTRAIVFALLSGAALGLDLALWHESIYAVGPGISTLLNGLQIFFLAAIGFICFSERQTKLQLVSLILAVGGVALIASPEMAVNTRAVWGFVAGIASGAFLALSMVLLRQSHRQDDVPIFPLMTLIGIGGAAVCLPMMWLFDTGKLMPTTLSEIGWVLVYGAVMQCMAWGLIAYSIPRLNLALTGLLLLSEPVAALLIDYFWLAKAINPVQWLGALLTMTAIYLGSVKR